MRRYTGYYSVSIADEVDGSVAASVTHYGEYAYLHEAYDFLLHWIAENGYSPQKPDPLGLRYCIKETYVKDSHNARLPEAFETRLTVRLVKKEKVK